MPSTCSTTIRGPGTSSPARSSSSAFASWVSRVLEGADGRADRIALFRRGVELIDQVVRSVLEETNAAFLFGRGEVEHRAIDVDERGDAEASWLLSWPEQRRAANVRSGGSVEPVRVVAWFAAAFTHPHLRGSRVGSWPFQVVDAGDALRQKPIVRAIVEAELHERIFEGTRKIIPASADPSPDDGDEHRKIPTHGGV